jgi:hypothetical protein
VSFSGPWPYGTDGGIDGPGDTSGSITVRGSGEGADWFLTTNDVFTVRSLTTITEIIRVIPAAGYGYIPVGGSLIPMGSIILNRNGVPIDSAMQTLNLSLGFTATSAPAGTGNVDLAFQTGGNFGVAVTPARSDHAHAQTDVAGLVAALALLAPLANPTFTGLVTMPNLQTTISAILGDSQSDLATLFGKLATGGNAPTVTVAAGGAAGAGATIGTVTGNDISGKAVLNVGTGPTAGNLLLVTFNTARAAAPEAAFAQEQGAAGNGNLYVTSLLAASIVIGCHAAPPASTAVTIGWFAS